MIGVHGTVIVSGLSRHLYVSEKRDRHRLDESLPREETA